MPPKTADLNRTAVKRHYDTHRTDVLKDRMIKRIKKGMIPKFSKLEEYEITNEDVNEYRKEAGLEPIEIKEPKRKKKKKVKEETKVIITLDNVVKMYEEMEMSAKTKKDYIGNITRILKETDCEDANIIECLKEDKIIEYLKDKYTNNNTRKVYLQAFLHLIDHNSVLKEELGELRDKYFDEWSVAKDKAAQDGIDKQLKDESRTFTSILQEVQDKYDSLSDEVLLYQLYDELTLRDDFNDVKVFKQSPKKDEVKPEKYYVVKTGTIHMDHFNKTDKKYPAVKQKLSPLLQRTIKESLEQNPRKNLLEKKTKSIFNKTKIGVNAIRHAKISEELKDITDRTKREELQAKMKHSPQTQMSYIRKIKNE